MATEKETKRSKMTSRNSSAGRSADANVPNNGAQPRRKELAPRLLGSGPGDGGRRRGLACADTAGNAGTRDEAVLHRRGGRDRRAERLMGVSEHRDG
ncbi:hypothetical protein CDD80_295 [Ophiocordyceps camponoti-rufipedis]|uniref:Uncharacterized protein n=1 Tax=Ophiocordyceps camponoti-rufipedis TaxID=2004952 RepID=A0A2C5YM03_9HYPO|nr:hypothetical protein CDD80_295 [Ophiocordyceps camponoti-rufipedis]